MKDCRDSQEHTTQMSLPRFFWRVTWAWHQIRKSKPELEKFWKKTDHPVEGVWQGIPPALSTSSPSRATTHTYSGNTTCSPTSIQTPTASGPTGDSGIIQTTPTSSIQTNTTGSIQTTTTFGPTGPSNIVQTTAPSIQTTAPSLSDPKGLFETTTPSSIPMSGG